VLLAAAAAARETGRYENNLDRLSGERKRERESGWAMQGEALLEIRQ
jgi:hypothetical protein